MLVTDRRAGRITEGTADLAAALQDIDLGDDVRAQFRATDQHRGVLVLSGPGLHPSISDTDPGDARAPGDLLESRPLHPAAAQTAAIVNRFVRKAHERLSSHTVNDARRRKGKPVANGIITRGAGASFGPENLVRQRGVNAVLVAGCNTVLGLARMFGMDAVTRRGFTASVDTDVEGKLAAARAALAEHELVYVHIKAPDLFSHDFQPEGKKAFIERVDRALGVLEGSGALLALAK